MSFIRKHYLFSLFIVVAAVVAYFGIQSHSADAFHGQYPEPTILSFTANTYTVSYGGSATLYFELGDAESCWGFGGSGNWDPSGDPDPWTGGTQKPINQFPNEVGVYPNVVSGITATSLYTIRCYDTSQRQLGGSYAEKVLQITVLTPTCTSAEPDYTVYSVDSYNHTVYINGVQNATWVYVWAWGPGQAPYTSSYAATQIPNTSTWQATIPISNHPGEGYINIEAWLYSPNATPFFCDTAHIARIYPPVNNNPTGLPTCSAGPYTAGTLSWTGYSADGYFTYQIHVGSPTGPLYGKSIVSNGTNSNSTSLSGFQDGSGNPLVFQPGTIYYGSVFNSHYTNPPVGGPIGPAYSNVVSWNVTYCVPTCTNATPDGDIWTTQNGNRVTSASGVANASNVIANVWSDQGGTDDLRQYYFTSNGGGSWSTTIPIGNHPGEGLINVQVYLIDGGGNSHFCDYANFYRQSPAAPGWIYGYVVEDKDGDGVFEGEDHFLHDPSLNPGSCVQPRAVSGFTIDYSGSGNGTAVPISFYCGTYSNTYIYYYLYLNPGTYNFHLNLPSGWQVALGGVDSTRTIPSGGGVCNGGYTPPGGPACYYWLREIPGVISGRIVHDTNQNAVHDAGEKYIVNAPTPGGCANYFESSGFNVGYVEQSSGYSGTITTFYCDATGPYYWQINVPPGTYDLTFNYPSGWSSSGPTTATVTVPVGGYAPSTLFYAYQTNQVGFVSGFVIKDTNGNGVQDVGEPYVINASYNNGNCGTPTEVTGLALTHTGPVVKSVSAFNCGSGNPPSYYDLTMPIGTYTVTPVLPSGWENTGAAVQNVTVPVQAYALSLYWYMRPIATTPQVSKVSLTQPNYCVSGPGITVSWTYSDPGEQPQSAYQVQIDDNSDFSSPEHDSGKQNSSSQYYFASSGLSYNKTYFVRVRAWNQGDNPSDWAPAAGQPPIFFVTPTHAYPDVDFDVDPSEPAMLEEIQFSDQTQFAAGSTDHVYLWNFDCGSQGEYCLVPTSSSPGVLNEYYEAGGYNVVLQVSDDAGVCSLTKPLTIGEAQLIPIWREVRPR